MGSCVVRAPNHTWPEPRPLAGDVSQPGDKDDDEAGQHPNICKIELSDLEVEYSLLALRLFCYSVMPVCMYGMT